MTNEIFDLSLKTLIKSYFLITFKWILFKQELN